MPRSKIGKKRPIPSAKFMEDAVNDVLKHGLSLRIAAVKYEISKYAIGRYVKKSKSNQDESAFSYKPKIDVKKIFSTEKEAEIVNYLKQASRLQYGLTTIQTRKLIVML
ncbi:hypothetical protein RN001_005501 [Aquatica leii]|uniref:HTH psq-type domain-containing protein n=1 Tax=Aquatica leii TaxID=1421715 RepID=A0AAN7SHW2_9COLE|nr:hypothetical protein RN001_005501 [Aquatica leii]